MRKKSYSMEISVLLMILIAVILIFASFLGSDTQLKVYGSPVFIILLAGFAICTVWCVFESKIALKRLGFIICHLGVVLFLIGAFIGYMYMDKVTGIKPVEDGRSIPYNVLNELVGTNKFYLPDKDTTMDIGFGITVKDFKIDYYDVVDEPNNPTYMVYNYMGKPVYIQKDKKGLFNFGTDSNGKMISVNENELNRNGKWVENYVLKEGITIKKTTMPPSVKRFVATVAIKDGEKSFDKEILVNHPLTYKGWRVYLMDYDHENNGSYVVLTLRNDPGRIPVIFGLWCIIIGTFMLCFRKKKEVQI